MLPDYFVDWWFTPWAYAENAGQGFPLASGWLGQRDAYRMWCRQADVVPDLPASFDPGWHIAVSTDPNRLAMTARLFAGLIAAREHNQQVLGELAFAERKWCVSIAATQPLRGCREAPYAADDAIEVRGLFELARRLEQRFTGMWSRLRLTLPGELVARVDALLGAELVSDDSEASSTRAQRCWMLCCARTAAAEPNGAAAMTSDSNEYDDERAAAMR